MIHRIGFVGALLVLCWFSCVQPDFYSQRMEISEEGWSFENPVTFVFSVEDTSARYDISLRLTHAYDYLYENLYTRTITEYPDGTERTQEIPMTLASSAGVWYGDCDRNTCEVEVSLQENAYFDQIGKHSITFEQFTRDNPLLGVQELSLKIYKR